MTSNSNKIALESLCMDLKRVALGYNRGSILMAKRFSEEALKRKSEINHTTLKPYIRNILNKLDVTLRNDNKQKVAEDFLMYSVLIQNYVRYSQKGL